MDARGHDRRFGEDVTVNQITWQVGSLREVGDAVGFFDDQKVEIQRTGRDMPGVQLAHVYLRSRRSYQ